MNELKKRTWAEISLANIRHNYESIRKTLPEGCRFLGVVKADAYGHGAVRVAKMLEEAGADYLAVACLDEALELRRGGVKMPVLILGHTPEEYTETLIDNNITQNAADPEKAGRYSEACRKLGKTLRVHLSMDTGMSRVGFQSAEEPTEEDIGRIEAACRLPGLDVEGIFTHFAVSDEAGEENEAYTRRQFIRFTGMIEKLAQRGITFKIRHCANSGATLHYLPEMALDMVRPGLLLYGYGDGENRLGLKPCMRLMTRIAAVRQYEPGTTVSYGRHYKTEKQERIGVLGIGYADGLHRAASGKALFCLGETEIPQVGNICMDMCMVNLDGAPEAEAGSEVEIFGEHARLERLVDTAGTITYELLCSVSKRVPRIYED